MAEHSGEDTFPIGAASMEAEHKSQLAMVDTLCHALQEGRDQEDVDDILEQVIDYTHVHFMAEELLMRIHEYPASHVHSQDHAKLLGQFRELRNGVAAGGIVDSLDAIEAIRSYLRAHITGHDLALSKYLGDRGVPAP